MEVDPSVTMSYWSVNPGFLQDGSSCVEFLARASEILRRRGAGSGEGGIKTGFLVLNYHVEGKRGRFKSDLRPRK